jgi:hypothetical protein
VAICAAHRAFIYFVPERSLKFGPTARMASDALARSHLRDLRLRLVHGVAGDARHLIARMATVNSPRIRRLIDVTGQAGAIRS